MGVGSGLGSQIVLAQETTFGTPLLTGARAIEFNSETLELKKKTVQGQGLHAGGLIDRSNRRGVVEYDVNGDVAFNVPTKSFGLVIENMIGSFGNATISAPVAGMCTQVHQPGTLQGHFMTLQKGVPGNDGTVTPVTYTGVKFADWELDQSKSAIMTCKLGCDGRDELLTTSTPTAGLGLASAAYLPTAREFNFLQCTVRTGTPTITSGVLSLASPTVLGYGEKFTLKGATPMKTDRYFFGSNGRKSEQIENGFRKLDGTLDVEWTLPAAWYNSFQSDATVPLQFTFVEPATLTNPCTLDMIIPACKLNGSSPKVGGPDMVMQNLSFTGLDDGTNPHIQFTYISTDTAI
jgi:hypothetical protein